MPVTVTGTVLERTGSSTVPLAGVPLSVAARLGGSAVGPSSTVSDESGLYRVDLPAGAHLSLTSFSPFFQPCVASLDVTTSSTRLDVTLIRDPNLLGAAVPADMLNGKPTLSGLVYEVTGGVRRPIPGVSLWYNAQPGDHAATKTDQDGRYVFCGIDMNARSPWLEVAASGYYELELTVTQAVEHTSFDFEMRRRPMK